MSSLKTQLYLAPGWLLMIGIALFSSFLSQRIVVGTRHPLESVTIAILIGLFLRNSLPLPILFHPGLSKYEMALKFGIIL